MPTHKKKPPVKKQERTAASRAVTKQDLLAALIDSRGIVTTACRQIGIERRTHYNWLRDDEDYATAVADIQDQALDFVEGQLLRKVQDMDTTAIIFYLKTKGKARGYVERVQTQEVKTEPFVVEREVVTTADPYTTTTT